MRKQNTSGKKQFEAKKIDITYTDHSYDHILLASNGEEVHILSDGFSNYSLVLRCDNTMSEVEEFICNGEFVKKLEVTEVVAKLNYSFVTSKDKHNVKDGKFPKKTGDWFSPAEQK